MLEAVRKTTALVACLGTVLPLQAFAGHPSAESAHELRITVVAWDAARRLLTYRLDGHPDERSGILVGDQKQLERIRAGAMLRVSIRTDAGGTEELVLARSKGARTTKIIWAILIVGVAVFVLGGTASNEGGPVAH